MKKTILKLLLQIKENIKNIKKEIETEGMSKVTENALEENDKLVDEMLELMTFDTISLEEYGRMHNFPPKFFKSPKTHDEIQDYMENDEHLLNYWSYPLTELDHIIENDLTVVVLQDSKKEKRYYEIPKN